MRAIDFIPQLQRKRKLSFDRLTSAVHRILRGYFLKIVIADNIAGTVNFIFSNNASDLTSFMAWYGAFLFSIQIFCDFSGYSDIAIGVAKLFGFDILENFRDPYLSKNLQEFWKKWHISLTQWFRDYLYYPLGGNKKGNMWTRINILIVFLISGLWHGARGTFLLWGLIHGFFLLLEKKISSHIKLKKTSLYQKIFSICVTYLFIIFTWVPFRSPSIAYTYNYWSKMLSGKMVFWNSNLFYNSFFYILIFLTFNIATKIMEKRFNPLSRLFCESIAFFFCILVFPGPETDFIYFQF